MQVTSCPDEDVDRERKALHKELTSIRRLANKCTDAAALAELKAGITALHDKFKDSSLLKRQSWDTDAHGLPPTKSLRRDNGDHVY